MDKEDKDQELPLPIEIPTIKKVVDCPKCGAKIQVEFEIELAPLIPTIADSLAMAGQPIKKKEENDKS